MAKIGQNTQLIDGERRVYDIADDGRQTLVSCTDKDGRTVAAVQGRTMAQVEAARPRRQVKS